MTKLGVLPTVNLSLIFCGLCIVIH